MKHPLCVLALTPFCFHSPVHGETKIWTGLSTNLPPKWSDPVNWKPSIPAEKDDVVIGEPPYSGQAHIEVAGPIKVKSLLLNRATLTGNAQIEVISLTSKGAALTEGGALKITGGATVIRGVTGEFGLLVDGWTIDNGGFLSILENSSIDFHGQAGRLNNSGTIDLADNTAIEGLSGAGSVVLNSGAMRKV
ncbi:MAG: TonB-dependent receptor [Pedosphaera sp.]|nr:TonB-dependent receptor [Pedosphaera sp.]